MAIGLIDPERLKNIPKKHWAAHELCFYLHDQIAKLAVSYERSQAGHIKIELLSDDDINAFNEACNPIDFLINTDRRTDEKRLVVNHICAAIFPDMLHFIFEALKALENRKFTVSLSLLRKPLKEAMPLIAMICASEDEFINSFRTGTSSYFDGKSFNADYKKKLIEDALNALGDVKFGDANTIYDICLNSKNETGLAQLFDKATHLFTSNRAIKTEDYNINFIFKEPKDNDIYDSIYYQTSYVLVFIHLMQVELLSRTGFRKDNYLSGFMMGAIGSFEAVHGKGRSGIVKIINKNFSKLMSCGTCGAEVKLLKKDAARFFLLEKIKCQDCGCETHFPFSWLLDRAENYSSR